MVSKPVVIKNNSGIDGTLLSTSVVCVCVCECVCVLKKILAGY